MYGTVSKRRSKKKKKKKDILFKNGGQTDVCHTLQNANLC